MLTSLFFIGCFVSVDPRWVKEMENSLLFEGDMVLSPDQHTSYNGGYASINTKLWRTRYIPYMLSADINQNPTAKANVLEALKEYEKNTCLRFRYRTNEMRYLHFYEGRGCSSPVGVRIGGNLISLASSCWNNRGSIVHEIGHSLGFFHEQARPDRDDHITINWSNIRQGSTNNFKKQQRRRIDSKGTPYDYKSVMHYSKTAFGSGKVTIVTKDPLMQDVIGQRNGLSETDVLQLNLMYKCVTKPSAASTVTTAMITVTSPLQTSSTTTRRKRTQMTTAFNGCVDKASNCNSMIQHCHSDDTWKTFMKSYCRKSCKHC